MSNDLEWFCMERELSNSSFRTSKVGTSRCQVSFVAEKAVESRRSSTNFNCKVSSVDGLSLNNLCGLESGKS